MNLDSLLDLSTLVSVATELAGDQDLTPEQEAAIRSHKTDVAPTLLNQVAQAISRGSDPLGTAYCTIRSAASRRQMGQTLTPVEAVVGMFRWAETQGSLARIVDPGAGSGRYVLTGLRRNTQAVGVACEVDPLMALLLRANATVLGVANRLEIHVGDFRSMPLGAIEGRTLFIGNPPYVRHHDIEPSWKRWYSDALQSLGHTSSQLAGLHIHFFVRTLQLSRPGDLGCFITAAEWLDVNYGQPLRDLMTNGLGGRAIFVVAPEVRVFDDAMVSACVSCFEPGTDADAIEFKRIESVPQLRDLSGGRRTEKERARNERSWSGLLRQDETFPREGFVSLGELFKVSRGQVTGMNRVWIANRELFGLPQSVFYPAITDAADIVRAPGAVISEGAALRNVIDLPADLDTLDDDDRREVEQFLAWARSLGADQGYIARHRNPWWKVNLKPPPPVVVTYMGRRPPVFAINEAGARLINVAHGLYPIVALSKPYLERLVTWLNANVSQSSGRVYAGGLVKFEPSEVMRLRVPSIQALMEGTA